MAYLESPDGVPIYYEDRGSGKTILLIHGWTMNAEYWWQKNVPELARTHRVVALDLRDTASRARPTMAILWPSMRGTYGN